jgi:hypothetical protein
MADNHSHNETTPEADMSELLVAGLTKSKHELESGISDAERELALTEEYCRKLEQLISVGKATLHAATQAANLQSPPNAATQANPQPTPRTEAPAPPSRLGPSPAAHEETPTDSENNPESDLRKRMTAEAGKSTPASQSA